MTVQLRKFLFTPIDNAPIVLFRIIFGFLMFCEVTGAILLGWVRETFIEPKHHLPFIGFEWLNLPSAGLIYTYYILMGIAALGIMFGAYYRFSTLAFAFLWWGSYLMQKVHYNNHYYLIILLAFAMAVIPANRYASWDVKRNPSLRGYTCPRWCSWFFILQTGIVFTYASIAKIYPDWLAAKPISLWFAAKAHYPILGPLFKTGWFKYFIAYSGIIFDLAITPLLLWRRTRMAAFILCIIFNLFNSIVFQIGGFPYLMITLTLFFFTPELIRKRFFRKKPAVDIATQTTYAYSNTVTAAFILYFIIQIMLPLRHLVYPGNTLWTEEAHRMSWHMMLRTKTGSITFYGKIPETGEQININLLEHFTLLQCRQIAKQPDMAWQAAQILKKIYTEKGYPTIALYAHTSVSLNGGPWKPMIDPETDLAQTPWNVFGHSPWILDYE